MATQKEDEPWARRALGKTSNQEEPYNFVVQKMTSRDKWQLKEEEDEPLVRRALKEEQSKKSPRTS